MRPQAARIVKGQRAGGLCSPLWSAARDLAAERPGHEQPDRAGAGPPAAHRGHFWLGGAGGS